MPIDSFGYQVMSLRELRAVLELQVLQHPDLADKPVWIRSNRLHYPVKSVKNAYDARGVTLMPELGL